ncbi:MAG TPA: PstS family phosphate ABC transporter substrate-binding protein [Candidatus Eremiobacteraeota bacterium]|nr:MAG: Phosphate-binding protein PstS precursor [bacterium ADurb.Bin363]HPZ07714.1 PstS family phosphate ABC transporter substrate-binding protein [Candidatus Eremiobacteraeota bacterium]
MRILYILLLITLIFSGCQKQNSGEPILVDGSTTIFELSKDWAEAYMAKNPGTKIQVSANGTTKGIADFLNGKIDIAESSRKISEEEILKAREKGVDVGEFYVGFNIYAVAVHPENQVKQLDKNQIKDIFSGKITNWKDTGGKDSEIKVLYREIPTGEYDYFLENFIHLSGNIDINKTLSHIKVLKTQEDIVKEVATNENAIGYFFLNYLDNTTKAIAVAKEKDGTYLTPSVENAQTGDYPILRPYYMYISKYANKPIRDFVDFTYSLEGTEITKKNGFVPVPLPEDKNREALFEYI